MYKITNYILLYNLIIQLISIKCNYLFSTLFLMIPSVPYTYIIVIEFINCRKLFILL